MGWRVIWIPELMGAILSGIIIFRLGTGEMSKILLRAYGGVIGFVRENPSYGSWREKTEKKLKRNGAKYHYGKKITAISYLSLRVVLGCLGILALSGTGFGYAILTAILLFYLPEILLLYLNKRDNQTMLPEIKMIYQALEVQIRAGVYVTDALTECCQSVKGRRLQQALMDLAGDIVVQSDLLTALTDFREKFDNRQIDALCITLIQAGESGQAIDLLGDMGEQLKDMEVMVMQHQKSALDRSITFYQLGILGAVLGVIIYACVGYMFRAAVTF